MEWIDSAHWFEMTKTLDGNCWRDIYGADGGTCRRWNSGGQIVWGGFWGKGETETQPCKMILKVHNEKFQFLQSNLSNLRLWWSCLGVKWTVSTHGACLSWGVGSSWWFLQWFVSWLVARQRDVGSASPEVLVERKKVWRSVLGIVGFVVWKGVADIGGNSSTLAVR